MKKWRVASGEWRAVTFVIFAFFAVTSCSSIPPEFFAKDKSLTAAGLYSVHPMTGLTGFGYLSYESKSEDAALEKRVETLEQVVGYLVDKLIEATPKE